MALAVLSAASVRASINFKDGPAFQALQKTAGIDVAIASPSVDLNDAVKKHDGDAVVAFMHDPSVDVNAPDADGFTPLMNAVATRDQRIVDLLLADGRVEVNRQTSGGVSATMMASNGAPAGILASLLRRPENRLDLKDESGNTALSWAVIADNVGAIRQLRQRGRISPADLDSARHLAQQFGHDDAARALT